MTLYGRGQMGKIRGSQGRRQEGREVSGGFGQPGIDRPEGGNRGGKEGKVLVGALMVGDSVKIKPST